MNENEDRTINKIISLLKTDRSIDAPADAVKWAKNIFSARAAAPRKSFASRILAVLQIDLSSDKAAFGERSAFAGQTRHLLFKADELGIDLRIKQEENGFSLYGQVLGEDFADGTIRLSDFETTANEVSEFEFVKIPGGKYDLVLRKNDKEIVVQDLKLK